MADPRNRRVGEQSPELAKIMTDAAAMREQIDALEARMLRLEAEVADARKAAEAAAKTPPRPSPSLPPAATRASIVPTSSPRSSKRPPGPPPLPKSTASMQAVRSKSTAGGRAVVDISEIAELVESVPPPPPRPRK